MGKGPLANTISIYTNPVMQGGTSTTSGAVSNDVFAEGMPTVRATDALPGPVKDAVPMGSTSVFINGRPAVRMTDVTEQGGSILTGAFTVIVGG